jgi:hypothetical protein
MKLVRIKNILLMMALASSHVIFAAPSSADAANPGLEDATILIIRHAEKPESGFGLSPAGEKRAEAYASYFKHFALPSNSQPLTPDYLIATADSAGSHRPRLTLEPLSKELGLKIDARFKNKNFEELAHELQTHKHGHRILICWHHGEIPALAKAFGADPGKWLPDGKWPTDEFGWMLLLRFDHDGHLKPGESQCIHEKLMPEDD